MEGLEVKRGGEGMRAEKVEEMEWEEREGREGEKRMGME